MTNTHQPGRTTVRWARLILPLALAVMLGVVLSACSGSSSEQADKGSAGAGGATRTNEGGQVTIKVTWQGPSAGPVFAVTLDTHSVDLDGYDLQQLAVLRTDEGQEVRPSGWGAPKGGHHREGTLTFPTTTADGAALIGPATRSIELVIRNVAGVPERTFAWTLST